MHSRSSCLLTLGYGYLTPLAYLFWPQAMFSIALAKSPRDDALGSRIHDQRVWPPAIFNQAFGWEWASDETVNSSGHDPVATRLNVLG